MKASNRLELLRDLDYFLREVIVRLERLVKIEPSAAVRPMWRQAAALARRVRQLTRQQAMQYARKAR